MLTVGIDEAGYGPMIGPLAVVAVAVEQPDPTALARELAAIGVGDSKRVHRPGNLAPLETVALALLGWQTGRPPSTAADVFALLEETADDRASTPWLAGAEALRLPVAATSITAFSSSTANVKRITGGLVHPEALNLAAHDGRNRAACEWDLIAKSLRVLTTQGAAEITVDRLGGRRYYGDPLVSCFPLARIEILKEQAAESRYRLERPDLALTIGFVVDGELRSHLVAAASCIAKYARELHMRLLNHWWSGRLPGLRPTAGYGSDAHRWIAEAESELGHHRFRLIRGVGPP